MQLLLFELFERYKLGKDLAGWIFGIDDHASQVLMDPVAVAFIAIVEIWPQADRVFEAFHRRRPARYGLRRSGCATIALHMGRVHCSTRSFANSEMINAPEIKAKRVVLMLSVHLFD